MLAVVLLTAQGFVINRLAGLPSPPHLVGLIRPVEVRHSADAEDKRSEGRPLRRRRALADPAHSHSLRR